MSQPFISRRRSNASKRRHDSVTPTSGGPPVKIAQHSTPCPACGLMMIAFQDMIVFDLVRRDWVHDGRGCRTGDTAHEG